MNDIIQSYLQNINGLKTIHNWAEYTGKFLKSELNFNPFIIIYHEPKPHPVTLIYSSDDSINFSDWKNTFKTFNKTLRQFESIEDGGYNYCFLDTDYTQTSGNFIVSKNPINPEILSIAKIWNDIQKLSQEIQNTKIKEFKAEHAGLSSQLMHDIQAIIDLTEKTGMSPPLKQRVDYQKKANKNFLFWIRDIELIKDNVPVKELILSSIQLLTKDVDKISLKISARDTEINADAELFAKAFNEILLNALNAVQNDLSKLEMEISICDSESPLLNNKWLKIQIRDTGTGISEDFLPFINNPFFTTAKKDGHTGFGLPIAKKIIEAHGGTIEIKSAQGMGTIVKFYLPV